VDVFISYRRAQRSKVEPIKSKLESLGLKVFFDVQGIDGGADFPTLIDANLRAAKAILACWSPLYFERKPSPDWCMIECRFGLSQQKLVPVAIERFVSDAAPVDLHGTNWLDLTSWRGQEEHEGWQRTLKTLSRLTGRAFNAHETPNTSREAKAPAPRPSLLLPEMVRIPAGEFMMGLPDSESRFLMADRERPHHRVRIKAFELGKYPITFAEWDAAIEAGASLRRPSDASWGRDRRPVIDVSWLEVQAYIDWLNGVTSGGYRLPSEAEWEYACRSGTKSAFSTGENIDESEARFASTSTAPVGSYPPNAFGLHDMHGNVWEWCEDVWHGDYDGAPDDGSAWIDGDCTYRPLRGGSWSAPTGILYSAARGQGLTSDTDESIGARVARTL